MTIGKYPIIYADPPWRYSQKGLQGAAENHYPTMNINELCALPVAKLAAPDSALFCGRLFPSSRRPCGSSRRGALPIKAWPLKKNRKADSWFYGLGFWTRGNAKSVCWQHGATPSGRRPMSTSLSFLPSRPTAKSPMRPVTRLCPSWAIFPVWSCSQDRPRPAGMCGETR